MSDNKTLNFTDFRARVGDLRGKEYWRSLEELSRSDVFDDFMHQEFPQQALALDKGVDRRNFMKLMGASVAMAGLAACRPPQETIVPYVNQPESLIPGKPLFFASAMPLGEMRRLRQPGDHGDEEEVDRQLHQQRVGNRPADHRLAAHRSEQRSGRLDVLRVAGEHGDQLRGLGLHPGPGHRSLDVGPAGRTDVRREPPRVVR